MDDRGEGASFEDVPELIEDDMAALLNEALDTTVVVAVCSNTLLDEPLDVTANVVVKKYAPSSEVLDIPALEDSVSDAVLDGTLDETVLIMAGASGFIADEELDYDELDSTVVSVGHSGSAVMPSGLIGLVEPVEVVDAVDGVLDRFESDAPAPPPVCTVVGASVPDTKVQCLVAGPRWSEKDERARPATASRSFWFLFFLLAAIAVVYGLSQYRHGGAAGEDTVALAQETVPPKGQALLLEPAQLRYCLAQGVRLGFAAEQTLNSATAARLQLIFKDFDQRCADHRFESGSLLAAKQAVEADRAELEQQGLSLLASIKLIHDPVRVTALVAEPQSPLEALVEAEPVVEKQGSSFETTLDGSAGREQIAVPIDLAPRRIIKDMQWRLFKLGLFNGSMDGVYGEGTQLAVKEFYRQRIDIVESQVEREIYRAIDRAYVNR